MRVIVNESQYNKILFKEQEVNKVAQEWSTYLTDKILPHIIGLETNFKEDVFTDTNLKNKLRNYKFFKELPIESIIYTIIKNVKDSEDIKVKVKYSPYWTYLNYDHIKDAEFDAVITLPSTPTNEQIEGIRYLLKKELSKEFIKISNWYDKERTKNEILKEQEVKNITYDVGVGNIHDTDLYDEVSFLNSLFYELTGKPIHILSIADNKIEIDYSSFNEEELEKVQKALEKISKAQGLEIPITFDSDNDMIVDLDKEIAPPSPVYDDDDNIFTISSVYEPIEVNSDSFYAVPSYWQPIMTVIGDAESEGNYNIKYPSTPVPGMVDMTIKEVGKLNAASGRWQLTHPVKQAKAAGIGENEKFSPTNQDKIAMNIILKKRGITKEMVKNNPAKVALKLAQEWAGLPVLEGVQGKKKWVNRGESYYEGDGINHAYVSVEKVEAALKQMGATIEISVADDTLGGIQFAKIPGSDNYRSGQPSATQLKNIIKEYDINHVIRLNKTEGAYNDLTSAEEEKVVKDMSEKLDRKITFEQVSAHTPRKGEVKDGKKLGYTKSIKKVIGDLKKGHTLIHCAWGADRTGYLVAAYLQQEKGVTDEVKLWNYTTNFNSWCDKVENNTFIGSGFDTYAQGFIKDLDQAKAQELCGNKKKVSSKLLKDMKVLFIGDSQTAWDGSFIRKLQKDKSVNSNYVEISKNGKNTATMLSDLKKELKEGNPKGYDLVVIWGGGNDAWRSDKGATAIKNLTSMYNHLQTFPDVSSVGVSNPSKQFYTGTKKYPSNQYIADFVNNQSLTDYKMNGNNLGKENYYMDKGPEKTKYLNNAGHDVLKQRFINLFK